LPAPSTVGKARRSRVGATRPDKAALISSGSTIDFATLNRRANKAANMLLNLGCELHDRVAVMSFNFLGDHLRDRLDPSGAS